MRHNRSVIIVVLTFIVSMPAYGASIIGGDSDEVLYGTAGTDTFYGGNGADTFVINYLSDEPDEIVDFDPREGDRVDLGFLKLYDLQSLDAVKRRMSINRKGVVKFRLDDGRDIDVVDTKRSGLTLEVDMRKGSYLLKFELKSM